jgi:nucleoside-diphosphate-sugar epimerase
MDVLVTGGNGFVGRHLVRALQERGDSVRVLALPSENTVTLEQRGISVYRGDVRDGETLAAPMRGVEAVFHLAAMMDVWRPIDEYRAVNVTGTLNVCNSALSANVRRLIHMSSSSVYGMSLGRSADEEFPLRPFRDSYPVTKAEGDQVVQEMIRQHHLPAVIIRPDQIFGPGDHLHFGHMADRLRAGRFVIVGSGRNAMPFVYVTDVVDGLLLALDHPRAVGRVYNITNDRPMTQAGFLTAIALDVGARPPSLHVPYRVLYAAGYAAERIATLSRSRDRPPITRLGAAFFGTHNRYAIGRARRELGYIPRVALRDGVRFTAAWYRHQLAELAGNTPSAVRSPERGG